MHDKQASFMVNAFFFSFSFFSLSFLCTAKKDVYLLMNSLIWGRKCRLGLPLWLFVIKTKLEQKFIGKRIGAVEETVVCIHWCILMTLNQVHERSSPSVASPLNTIMALSEKHSIKQRWRLLTGLPWHGYTGAGMRFISELCRKTDEVWALIQELI